MHKDNGWNRNKYQKLLDVQTTLSMCINLYMVTDYDAEA
jgi:hypothetical protein